MNENYNNDAAPHISVNAQYIKDFSFENSKAPASLATLKDVPKIELSLDLRVTRLPEPDTFEVAIAIEAKASNEAFSPLFICELVYAGIFTLQNIPEEQHQVLLAIHCPSLIFPYARKIIADATQDGGFQPLMIDPIDFGALYQKKMLEEDERAAHS